MTKLERKMITIQWENTKNNNKRKKSIRNHPLRMRKQTIYNVIISRYNKKTQNLDTIRRHKLGVRRHQETIRNSKLTLRNSKNLLRTHKIQLDQNTIRKHNFEIRRYQNTLWTD